MTKNQFKRLFFLLLGPLLIAGGILATVEAKKAGARMIFCQPIVHWSKNNSCRSVSWDRFVRIMDGAVLFDVYTQSSSNPYTSASSRVVSGVQILEVSPYLGTDASPGSALSQLRAMAGQEISIILGISDNEYRQLDPLACNGLTFQEGSSEVFKAGCHIPDGVASVKFRVDSQSQSELLRLKADIDEELERRRQEVVSIFLMITPIFIVIFLLISGIIWSIRRAMAYVMSA